MPVIELSGTSLFYARYGNGRSLAVLLLHGAGGSHLDWPTGLRRPEGMPDTAVYAPDLPGHGRSPSPGRNSISAYADVISEFITALGLTRVALVGHSMGGAIALELALRQLPQVVALALLATGARLPVAEAILTQSISNFAAVTEFITRHAWAAHVPEAARQVALMRLRQTSAEVLHGDFIACNQFDARGRLAEIGVPVLVIGADEDKMTPPRFSQYLAEHIPGAALLLLPQTGHMLTLEREVEVATAVRDFLQRSVQKEPGTENASLLLE